MAVLLSLNTTIYVGISFTLFTWFVLAPITLYYAYQFWTNRKKHYIAKRHPNLVIICIISLLINSMIIKPYSFYIDIHFYSEHNLYETIIFNKIFSTLITWYTLLIALLLNIRLFKIYYDWNKSKHLLSMKWKLQTIYYNQQSIKYKSYLLPWTLNKFGSFIGNIKSLIFISILWFIIAEIIIVLST